jgi:hypothetical protein
MNSLTGPARLIKNHQGDDFLVDCEGCEGCYMKDKFQRHPFSLGACRRLKNGSVFFVRDKDGKLHEVE